MPQHARPGSSQALAAVVATARESQARYDSTRISSCFSPPALTIPAGTTVTWVNDEQAKHTATADDGSFDSGDQDLGESFTYTFTEPGVYPYFCRYHGDVDGVGMAGTIVVEVSFTPRNRERDRSSLAIASPRPLPPEPARGPASAWRTRRICGESPPGDPDALATTLNSTPPPAIQAVVRTLPSSVNLIALPGRLINTLTSRCGSAGAGSDTPARSCSSAPRRRWFISDT